LSWEVTKQLRTLKPEASITVDKRPTPKKIEEKEF